MKSENLEPERDVPENEKSEARPSVDTQEDQPDGAIGSAAMESTITEGMSGGEAPGEPPGGGDEVGTARLAEELDSVKDKYLRLAAEFENFRKRTSRERLETGERAQAQLVQKLLESLDDLQRVAHLDADGTEVSAVLEGVQLVERKLIRALEDAGLELLDAQGQPFDPELHEALMTVPTDEPGEDETVGQVFQPGYRFRGTLLRPARVQVRKHGG